MEGEVIAIRLSPAVGALQQEVQSVDAVIGGLQGDHHCDVRSKRQISVIDQSRLDELGDELGIKIEHGAIRENIVTRGMHLETLEEGDRLQLGDAVIEVTKARTPCHIMTTVHPDLRQKMEGRAGVMARVVQPGKISINDKIRVLSPVA